MNYLPVEFSKPDGAPVAAMALLLASASAGAAPYLSLPVANAGFEQPVGVGAFFETPSLYDQGGSGWTFDNVGGNAGIAATSSIYYTPPGGASPDGGQFGYLKYGGGFYQTISGFNAGEASVSFYAVGISATTTIDIKLGGTSLTFGGNSVAIHDTAWTFYRSDSIWLEESGSYDLLFGRMENNGDGNANAGSYFDGIVVMTVPEPTVLAMMALALPGLVRRPRQSSKRASKPS